MFNHIISMATALAYGPISMPKYKNVVHLFHSVIHSTTPVCKISSTYHNFRHPVLSQAEMQQGCKLGIDSYADTSCAGRHSHVISFVEGKEITAKAWNNHETSNLRVANVAYAYDLPTGQPIILILNQAIYGGELMEDGLLQPIQCLMNDVEVDTRPQQYYDEGQMIRLNDSLSLPLKYNGPLPYIDVRRPTQDEFDNCGL